MLYFLSYVLEESLLCYTFNSVSENNTSINLKSSEKWQIQFFNHESKFDNLRSG